MGKLAEAEPYFREALRILPDNAAMYGNIGRCCQQLGKLAESAEALRRATELTPKEARIFGSWG